MRQQQSFRGGLIGGLAMLCLASAQLACQPRAPEHSDVLPTTAAQHAPEAGGGQVHWTYDGETGAARWGELDPSFAVCAEGAQQSPVDLAGPIPAGTGTLDIQWQPAEAYVVDNGHTIQVDVAEGSSITLEGRRFSLLQFHFHLPSEHMVDGDGFPMEVHFVHQAAEGDLAVVGVFMGTGESHPAIERIWGAIPGSGEPSATLPELDPRTLLPEGSGLFPLRRLPDHASVFRNGKLGGDDRANFSLASACRRLRGSSSHERAPDSGAQPAIHSVPAVGEQPPHTPSPPPESLPHRPGRAYP